MTAGRKRDTRAWAELLALASMSVGVYALAFTRPMWLPDYYFLPHMDTPRILGVGEGSLSRFLGAFGVLFALYLVALRITFDLRSRASAVVILALGCLLALPALLMHPGGAGDVYMYIAWADVTLRYGENPFAVPPAAIPQYQLLPFLDFPRETVQYGPLWVAISLILRFASGDGLFASLVAFKVAAATSLLLAAWLVYLTVRESKPEWAVPSMLLVAWNPALIFEMAGNGHNDAVMATLVAGSFYLYRRGSLRMSVIALLAAAMVKYVAIILLPIMFAHMLRNAGNPRAWLPKAGAFSLGLFVPALALLWVVGLEGTVGVVLDRTQLFTTSASAVVRLWLARSMDTQSVELLIVRPAQFAFAAYLLIETWRVWRQGSDLAGSALRVMIAFMLLVISWYQPWYTVWAIPLAALHASHRASEIAVGLSVGAVLIHAVMGFGWRLEWHEGDLLVIQTIGTLAAWLPTILVLLYASMPRHASTSKGRPGELGPPTPVVPRTRSAPDPVDTHSRAA